MNGPGLSPTVARRPVLLLCLFAGLCDGLTGLLLVGAPGTTLKLMGVPAAGEPIWIRYIGVFVASIGAAYLYPWWSRRASADGLAAVLEITALSRFAVTAFVTTAVVWGDLAPGWTLVAVTDAAVASLQLFFLCRGTAPRGAST